MQQSVQPASGTLRVRKAAAAANAATWPFTAPTMSKEHIDYTVGVKEGPAEGTRSDQISQSSRLPMIASPTLAVLRRKYDEIQLDHELHSQ